MKKEKKDNLFRKNKYVKILDRNKKINKANIIVIAIALLLTLTDYAVLGKQIIWFCVLILVTTLGSNFVARAGIRKLK